MLAELMRIESESFRRNRPQDLKAELIKGSMLVCLSDED